jgi:dolichol-phosphate mannosyltransferase
MVDDGSSDGTWSAPKQQKLYMSLPHRIVKKVIAFATNKLVTDAKGEAFMNVEQINAALDAKRKLTELPERSAHIAVVIPAYRVEDYIAEVIAQVPSLVRTIVGVDDKSPDGTGNLLNRLARTNRRLIIIHHERNCGVGAATKSGYLEALRQGADIVVKLDGDGQMNSEYIESLVAPIVSGQAEYTKGNRFEDWNYLRTMPLGRKIGNLGLSFLIKFASGYWNVFDPTNGFTAISAKTLRKINFERLEDRYLFESSMLVELYGHIARIKQVPMPAVYNGETSSLNIWRSLVEFPVYLLPALMRRFVHRYIWQDFTAVSVFVILGILSMLFGATFGGYHWIRSWQTMHPATAGQVMLSAVPVILGFQLLLQAIVLDIENVPK